MTTRFREILTEINAWWRKRIIAVRHMLYRKRQVRRIQNHSPSILSFDCAGGVISHDLRMQFNSPTVNLFFDSYDDFIDYVSDLRYYTGVEVQECEPSVSPSGEIYPIGILPGDADHRDVKIHFLHYHSFLEARQKWVERTCRLNFDNLAVIMQAAELDQRLLARFVALPISRKVILAYRTLPLESPMIFKMHSLLEFIPGRILNYNGLSGRRYLDDFDYVAFLNDGSIGGHD